jgi:hypothetical protein
MRKACIAAIMVMTLSGCLMTHRMDFNLPAPDLRAASVWGQSVGVGVSVSDRRVDRTKVGMTFTPGNGREYALISNNGMEEPVRKGVIAELAARKIHVSDGPAFLLVDIVNADSKSVLHGMRTSVDASAELAVQVMGADGRKYYQRSFRRNESGRGEFWTFEYLEQGAFLLESLLAGLIREMLDDPNVNQAIAAAGKAS